MSRIQPSSQDHAPSIGSALEGAKRVEVIGEATLILGDCRDILPTLGPVDAVVTDPPYGINAARDRNSQKDGWRDYPSEGWDVERPGREVFDAIRACSRDQIVWGGNYFTDYLPPSMQWLVWDKGQRDFSLADCEFAWSSQNRAARVFTYPRARAMRDGKEHPTQKPVMLMAWCLDFVERAKVICDPFMGAGTTGVACVDKGRAFIGIEREPAYFDIACRRIAEAYRQPRLFEEPAPKPVQDKLFGDAAPAGSGPASVAAPVGQPIRDELPIDSGMTTNGVAA